MVWSDTTLELKELLDTTMRDSDGDEIQGACCPHIHICSGMGKEKYPEES